MRQVMMKLNKRKKSEGGQMENEDRWVIKREMEKGKSKGRKSRCCLRNNGTCICCKIDEIEREKLIKNK